MSTRGPTPAAAPGAAVQVEAARAAQRTLRRLRERPLTPGAPRRQIYGSGKVRVRSDASTQQPPPPDPRRLAPHEKTRAASRTLNAGLRRAALGSGSLAPLGGVLRSGVTPDDTRICIHVPYREPNRASPATKTSVLGFAAFGTGKGVGTTPASRGASATGKPAMVDSGNPGPGPLIESGRPP